MSTDSQPLLAALDQIQDRSIEAHLRFLADPLLEGRGVGSRGGQLAERYIRSRFQAAGLEPGNGDSYFQTVPMVGMNPSPQLSFLGAPGDRVEPRYRDDYVMEAGVPEQDVAVNGELVFCGYGIYAPEYGWDDFGGMDLRGKILLIRVNDPGDASTPDFFQGRALTYYGRWKYKFEEAARRGAAGAILIHTDASAGYGWNVVRTSNTGEQYSLAGEPAHPLPIKAWITEATAERIFAGMDGDPLADSAKAEFEARPTGWTVEASVHSSIREIETRNVLARLPGTEPELADQPVILMSHHDHLGVTQLDDGSRAIYPGAYDNASGVSVLLAMAEALAATGTRFRRPLLFLASTAEESGLLGSSWYAEHPVHPLARTAAVLNIDGANLNGPTRDIAPLGVDRSQLGPLLEAAAHEERMTVTPEQHPEQGMFFRQDHFPFARGGVPALAFDHGLDYLEKPEGWGEEWYEQFNTLHYHQPTDAFSEDFDYRGAVQQGRVILRVAQAVADEDALPEWNADSEFSRPT